MSPAGFPHSEILGSTFGCQLPEAYRRLLRPSSAPGAKASTVCPYKLDHKVLEMLASTVQFSRYGRSRLRARRLLVQDEWFVVSSIQIRAPLLAVPRGCRLGPIPQDPTACQAAFPSLLRSVPANQVYLLQLRMTAN